MTEPLTCPGNPGWDNILVRLAATLRQVGYDGPVAVDEKWGHLRIDVGAAAFDVHDAVEAAEVESESVCSQCGKPGRTKSFGGWLYTVCDLCPPIMGWGG